MSSTNCKSIDVTPNSYRVIRGEQRPSAVQLSYICKGQEINSFIDLTTTPLPWGGHRYWFTCPNLTCQRRVANLYLKPGDPYFACRACHQLTYRSCQEKGQSFSYLADLAELMQDVYPGVTANDMAALLDGKYTNHMKQILMEKYLRNLENLPDPYENYLTAHELCEQSGLSLEGFEQLSALRLLLPDHEAKFRPKLLKWAQKLAYLLNQGWAPDEIKRWAKGRFQTENPKDWPPDRGRWQV